MMAPSTPASTSVRRARTSSRVETPPDATTQLQTPWPPGGFSVQLINDGNVTIYYQMGGSWFEATPNGGYFQKANGNNTYLLQGGVFSAVKVVSDSPFKEYKQNSITLGNIAIPEPGSWMLMLLGFGGMGVALRRGRRRSKPTLMQMA